MIFRYSKELMKKFGNVIYNYFLSKFMYHQRRYYIRGHGENRVDLSNFIKESMSDDKIKIRSAWFKSMNEGQDGYDDIVIDILRWVWGNTDYVSDQESWGVPEYWQNARTTLDKKKGDCEDGAILLLSLARNAGVPENRIFLTCGYVDYNKGTSGHAYVTYRGDDGVNYILDWCYFYDKRRIPNHKTVDDKRYWTPWWFGNDRGFYQ